LALIGGGAQARLRVRPTVERGSSQFDSRFGPASKPERVPATAMAERPGAPRGLSLASIVISKPPVAVQLPQPDVSANRDAAHKRVPASSETSLHSARGTPRRTMSPWPFAIYPLGRTPSEGDAKIFAPHGQASLPAHKVATIGIFGLPAFTEDFLIRGQIEWRLYRFNTCADAPRLWSFSIIWACSFAALATKDTGQAFYLQGSTFFSSSAAS